MNLVVWGGGGSKLTAYDLRLLGGGREDQLRMTWRALGGG